MARTQEGKPHHSERRKHQQIRATHRDRILLESFVMARKPRTFIPGAGVHVIHRGNNRGPIVRDDADREVLLALLRRASERYGLSVHGYVVMNTHYHLMVTPTYEGCLSAAMKELGTSATSTTATGAAARYGTAAFATCLSSTNGTG